VKKLNKLTIGLMCILAILAISMVASAQDDWDDFWGDDGAGGTGGAFLGLGLAMCAVWILVSQQFSIY
jgi:hypothetical protein